MVSFFKKHRDEIDFLCVYTIIFSFVFLISLLMLYLLSLKIDIHQMIVVIVALVIAYILTNRNRVMKLVGLIRFFFHTDF